MKWFVLSIFGWKEALSLYMSCRCNGLDRDLLVSSIFVHHVFTPGNYTDLYVNTSAAYIHMCNLSNGHAFSPYRGSYKVGKETMWSFVHSDSKLIILEWNLPRIAEIAGLRTERVTDEIGFINQLTVINNSFGHVWVFLWIKYSISVHGKKCIKYRMVLVIVLEVALLKRKWRVRAGK